MNVVALLGEKWSTDHKDGVVLCFSQVNKWSYIYYAAMSLQSDFGFISLVFLCCLIFFFGCREPNPDTVLIIQTPSGVFSAKNLAQNKKSTGSRLILANREEVEEPPPEEAVPVDPFSCARCRVFKRKVNSKKVNLWKTLYA